jgi:hypothetical protein
MTYSRHRWFAASVIQWPTVVLGLSGYMVKERLVFYYQALEKFYNWNFLKHSKPTRSKYNLPLGVEFYLTVSIAFVKVFITSTSTFNLFLNYFFILSNYYVVHSYNLYSSFGSSIGFWISFSLNILTNPIHYLQLKRLLISEVTRFDSNEATWELIIGNVIHLDKSTVRFHKSKSANFYAHLVHCCL